MVTGGAGGIGSAIVQRFLNDGAKVAVLDMNERTAEAKIREIVGGDSSLAANIKFFHRDGR